RAQSLTGPARRHAPGHRAAPAACPGPRKPPDARRSARADRRAGVVPGGAALGAGPDKVRRRAEGGPQPAHLPAPRLAAVEAGAARPAGPGQPASASLIAWRPSPALAPSGAPPWAK